MHVRVQFPTGMDYWNGIFSFFNFYFPLTVNNVYISYVNYVAIMNDFVQYSGNLSLVRLLTFVVKISTNKFLST